MSDSQYTFNVTSNSYFSGKDLVVTENGTGATITVNTKDNMLAVAVKDNTIRREYPADVNAAAEKIGEDRVAGLYEVEQGEFWRWATDAAAPYGLHVFQAGRSGGWLAVGGTEGYGSGVLLAPHDAEDEAIRDRFLAFAFEVVAGIEDFRGQFFKAIIDAANEPETMRIMVLNDGETFSALDGCKIIEVNADLDTDEIEALLADDPMHRTVQTFQEA